MGNQANVGCVCDHSSDEVAMLIPVDPQLGMSEHPAGNMGHVRSSSSKATGNDLNQTAFGGGSKEPRRASVLAWTMSAHCQATTDPTDLLKLNEYIVSCAAALNCQILLDEATHGLILGGASPDGSMNPQDSAVRLGQLICRYGTARRVALRAGVAMGEMCGLTLASGRISYFGSASGRASRLAEATGQDLMVHMSREVKESLSALRLVRVTIAPSRASYYLDPSTTVSNQYANARNGGRSGDTGTDTLAISMFLEGKQGNLLLSPRTAAQFPVKDVATLEEFSNLLHQFEVETSRFGAWPAATLEEFFQAVVLERRVHLSIEDGKLERVVNFLRISLRTADTFGNFWELRIKRQHPGVHLRISDQPLVITFILIDTARWMEGLHKFLEEKLQINAKMLAQHFSIDESSYSLREQRTESASVPGITTLYRTHEITVNVRDKNKKELKAYGLPKGVDFKIGDKTWTWTAVTDSREDELMKVLQMYGIDVADFSPQAFAELFDEVYIRNLASLDVQDGRLVRTIRMIKVWLHADILNVDHVVVVKSRSHRGVVDLPSKDSPVAMRMGVEQEWPEAVGAALEARLGLQQSFQADNLMLDRPSHKVLEEVGYSRAYPGLTTNYIVNEVNAHILNCNQGGQCLFIGLPSGTEFAISRKEAGAGPDNEEAIVIQYEWKMSDQVRQNAYMTMCASVSYAETAGDDDSAIANAGFDEVGDGMRGDRSFDAEEERARSRVPAPTPLQLSSMSEKSSPVGALSALMKKPRTDWTRAKRAAADIRKRSYTCKEYFEDLTAAFPELRLYCVKGKDGKDAPTMTISGRTTDDEYQRTIGALFAFYWIMRLDIGGKESFCFGLDSQWMPLDSKGRPERSEEDTAKREEFYENTSWSVIQKLLIDGGLLFDDLTPDPQRTLSMLVLLAVHDIMKVRELLPVVAKEEFCGYEVGETITDHDVALSYVMMNYPAALPSFAGLQKGQQSSLMFTHCKMEYNMGWLVQAEAPPGALFRAFKKAIQAGQAPSQDVAFYFVHWFCDLAAAEPTPLEGCEKFVLKFPQRVLSQFLESFSIVQRLGTEKTETEVLEDYLESRWKVAASELGEPPMGRASIAQLRLVLMAQGDSAAFVQGLMDLPEEDLHILAEEMAYTGIADQSYSRDFVVHGRGPAIMVYYGPALLQRAGKKDPRGALKILAEVYRGARELWPLREELADKTVTVRIDALKELETSAIAFPDSGYVWVVQKTSGRDAMVKTLALSLLDSTDFTTHKILTFNRMENPTEKKKGAKTSRLFARPMLLRRLSSFK